LCADAFAFTKLAESDKELSRGGADIYHQPTHIQKACTQSHPMHVNITAEHMLVSIQSVRHTQKRIFTWQMQPCQSSAQTSKQKSLRLGAAAIIIFLVAFFQPEPEHLGSSHKTHNYFPETAIHFPHFHQRKTASCGAHHDLDGIPHAISFLCEVLYKSGVKCDSKCPFRDMKCSFFYRRSLKIS
jgi:hypothetical protein